MKARKRLLALVTSATLGVASLALGVHCLLPQDLSTAKAEEETAFTVTNLENLVNEGTHIKFVSGYSGLKTLYDGSSDANLNTLNTYSKDTTLQWALFNDTTEYNHTVNYPTGQSWTGNINANDYAGNYSLFVNDTDGSNMQFTFFDIVNGAADTVVSFNMTYTARQYVFLTRTDDTYNKYSTGYGIKFHWKTTDYLQIGPVTSDRTITNKLEDTRYSQTDFVSAYNTANGLTGENKKTIDDLLTKEDILNVTYGAYDTDTTTYVYFRLYNLTKGILLTEQTVDMGELDATKSGCMRIAVTAYNDNTGQNDRKPVTIAGVNEPLLQNGYDASAVAGDYKEGDALSTVALPMGYTWKDEAQTLLAGENEYEAVYAYEYYGNKTAECKVTVTAEALPNNTVTIKDANGETVAQSNVKVGESYTFTALDSRAKAFVAYKDGNGAYYNVGDVITPNGNVEYTLVEVDFALNEKVSVRMIQTEEYFGGLRYTAQMSASDYATLDLTKVSINTMIIPTDLIVGELDVNEESAKKEVATISDLEENKVAMFALTNIRHYNYDRQYSGMAYLQITYADGDIAYVKTNVMSVSAYDLAIAAYAANELEIKRLSVGIYSNANLAILERYINGVIDLTYHVENSAITSLEFAELGLDLAKGYTLKNWSDEGDTVAVTLNIKDSVLETLLVDGESLAPVVIRQDNGAYTAVNATHTYNAETGELVLNFSIEA